MSQDFNTEQRETKDLTPIGAILARRSAPLSREASEGIERENVERERREALQKQNKIYCENVPMLFRNFDVNKVPNRVAAERILAWQYQPTGIIAHGETGKAKTFVMYALIHKLIEKNFTAKCLSTYDFAIGIQDAQGEFAIGKYIQSLINPSVLFLDELGQIKLSELAEASLLAVIDKRIGFKKPTLYTTNYNGKLLEQRFQDQRGSPTVRRIREFSIDVPF